MRDKLKATLLSAVTVVAYLGVIPTAAQAAPAAQAAAPGPATKAATPTNVTHGVYAIESNPDGTGRITIWDPMLGVSADQLYRRLKTQGLAGLVDPALGDAATGPGLAASALEVDCSIQGAYAWGQLCGINQLHWAGTYPTVNFMDHTGSAWPVTNALVSWDQTWAVNPEYHWYTTYSCTSNCVHVHDANYGDTGWVGRTYIYYSGVILTSALIQLNDYRDITSGQHRNATCHEMGHALGLGHNLFTSSCMYWQNTTSASQYPATGDYLMLEQIYL